MRAGQPGVPRKTRSNLRLQRRDKLKETFSPVLLPPPPPSPPSPMRSNIFRLHRQNLARMASTGASGKAIFAPAGQNRSSAQAEQYLSGTLQLRDLSASPLSQFSSWFASAQSSGVFQPETCCLSTASRPSGSVSSRFVYLKELDARGFVLYSNWDTSRKAADVRSNPRAALAFWWREQERQVRVEGETERLSRDESHEYFRLRARGSKIGAWASRQSEVLEPEPEPEPEAASTAATTTTTTAEEDGRDGLDSGASNANRQGGGEGGEGGGGGGGRDDGRAVLDRRVKDVALRFQHLKDDEIQVPEFWGGMRIVPTVIEFWQGRDSRLHDRFRYTRIDGAGDGSDGGGGAGGREGEGKGWKIERLSP